MTNIVERCTRYAGVRPGNCIVLCVMDDHRPNDHITKKYSRAMIYLICRSTAGEGWSGGRSGGLLGPENEW